MGGASCPKGPSCNTRTDQTDSCKIWGRCPAVAASAAATIGVARRAGPETTGAGAKTAAAAADHTAASATHRTAKIRASASATGEAIAAAAAAATAATIAAAENRYCKADSSTG